MLTMQEATKDFLSQKKIAVAGVSHTKDDAANNIYRKLRSEGYHVFAVTPNTAVVEGDVCYPDIKAIPEKIDGVVIVTKPEVTEQIVQQCAEVGINRVWMHKGMAALGSSVSEKAVAYCNEHGITAIPGGCPQMYCEHADFGHKCMRWMLNFTGSLPKQV
jgi:uncharacterized protein